MAAQTFEMFIQKERERLGKLREDVLARKALCEQELADIDKELTAISAYEAAKTGKPAAKLRTGKRRIGQRDAVPLVGTLGRPEDTARLDAHMAYHAYGVVHDLEVVELLRAKVVRH